MKSTSALDVMSLTVTGSFILRITPLILTVEYHMNVTTINGLPNKFDFFTF